MCVEWPGAAVCPCLRQTEKQKTKQSLVDQPSVLLKLPLGSQINPVAATFMGVCSRVLFSHVQGICGAFAYETPCYKLRVVSNYRRWVWILLLLFLLGFFLNFWSTYVVKESLNLKGREDKAFGYGGTLLSYQHLEWEAEAGGLRVQGQPVLHSETLFQTRRQNCHFGAGGTAAWQSVCLTFINQHHIYFYSWVL